MREQQEYNAGIYCRLSIDDGNNSESMSIGNQKQMLTEHVRQQGWRAEEIYIDDGYSGTSFDRPSFKRMLDDIERGRINLVIVKDLSRLGRNYIMCGQFTEIYFPSKNVRFVALNDGIDSLHSNNDIAPFKNILNDMYAKDISVKIRTALHAKARRGEYLGATNPYGYLQDPKDKHHLVVNPEVAPTIKRIFELIVSGYGFGRIAGMFNREGVLSPRDYHLYRKHDPAQGEFVATNIWRECSVKGIVRNQRYIGHMVACRKRSESYRTQKLVWTDPEDWIVVKNTHEPIVSEELFNEAQRVIAGRTQIIKPKDEPHMFSGLFFCKACGRRMAHRTRDSNAGDYYSCGLYRELGRGYCSAHTITFNTVYDVVLRDIQANVRLLQEDEQKALKRIMDSLCADEKKRMATAKKDLARQQKRQAELGTHIKKMYEDKLTGALPNDLFQTFLRDYNAEKAALHESISALEEELRRLESSKENAARFIALLKEYPDVSKLDRHILLALIEKITIDEPPDSKGRYRDQTIDIHYKFVGTL